MNTTFKKDCQADIEKIVETARQSGTKLVRFLYCDTSNVIRGKCASIESLQAKLSQGIGLVKGMMAMNLVDKLQTETGLGATGEVRLFPDLSTFQILPYMEGQAQVLCNLLELDQSPWELCPRSVLARQIERARAMNIEVEAAFEPEFMLGEITEGGYHPLDRSRCFSTEGMNRAAPFIADFGRALNAQSLEVEQYYPELGHGQHELSIKHAQAMAAADRHIFYRETLRAISFKHGLMASLAPKPFLDQPGNGCHLHLSLWDKKSGKNLFYDENAPNQFSELARSFVAGICEHLPALVAFTCASVNSYRRLQPNSWSSAYRSWGFENREAAVRVPSLYWGAEEASANIEIKCVDSSANPYLALAAVIASGLDGVERKCQPQAPVACEPGSLADDVKKAMGISRLPETLMDALLELERDRVLMKEMGESLVRTFMIVKSSEVSEFARKDIHYELEQHRTVF